MRRRRLESLLVHAALAAGALVTLAPLFWMVAASFMQPGEANTLPPPLWPHRPTVANYAALFTRLDMLRHFLASAGIAVAATVASVLVNSLAGYAFAKLPFRGRDRLFGGLVAGLVVPAQVAMLPLFLLLRELHLITATMPSWRCASEPLAPETRCHANIVDVCDVVLTTENQYLLRSGIEIGALRSIV